MSTPTPRHGPGQFNAGDPPPGWPPPPAPPRPRRSTGQQVLIALGIAAGAVVALVVAIAVFGSAGDEAPSSASTQPAAATASDALTECTDALRAEVADGSSPAADLPAVCVALGQDGAQRALDTVAAEYGVDTKATTAAAASGALPAPKGVTVSGDYADTIRIRSFKAERDALDSFAVVLRLQNAGAAAEYVGVKVTALRGEEVVATADGLIESIDAGQTITTEPISADAFPKSTKGITYEVELGS